MDNKRYGFLDLLRIFASIAVIVIHMVTSTVYNNTAPVMPLTKTICSMVHSFMNFSVPIFLMITGYIFLGNEIIYTYKRMKKYILRIAIALLLFGSFYSILEQIFTARTFVPVMIFRSLYDIASGNLWDHLWYLYVILGIYLIIPIIKPYFTMQTVGTLTGIGLILLLCNHLIPELNNTFGIEIISVIPVCSQYIFYILAGGILAKLHLKAIHTYFSIAGLIASIGLIIFKYQNSLNINTEYSSIIICILTVSIFVLTMQFFGNYVSNKFVIDISKCTWGIYLLHPLLLNVQLKVLGLNPIQFYPAITIPLNCITLFFITYWIIKLLRRVSFVQRNIL